MSMISARAGKVEAGRARHRLSGTELTFGDRVLRAVSAVASVVPMFILGVIAVVMFITALPSIIFSGLSFFTGSVFNFGNLYATTTITHNGVQAPPHAVYGVVPLIVGTLSTSIIALVIAVPVSVGGVLMLSEIIPRRIAELDGGLSRAAGGHSERCVRLVGSRRVRSRSSQRTCSRRSRRSAT